MPKNLNSETKKAVACDQCDTWYHKDCMFMNSNVGFTPASGTSHGTVLTADFQILVQHSLIQLH